VWRETVANTEAGITTLLLRTPSFSPVVVEPTGRYSLLIAKEARAKGHKVLLAEPKKAKHFLLSLPPRAKTDRLDSAGLSLFALSCSLPPYPLKDAAVDTLDQLLKARKGIVQSISTLRQSAEDLPRVTETLMESVALLEKQKGKIDKQIAEERHSDPRFDVMRLLETVPGVGPVTSATVASCLIARGFTNPDQFVAFIGLDPSTRQSGQKDGKGRLTKKGDPEIRRLLYLAAQSNLRSKTSPYKALYEHHREGGLASTAALCAVARKLARTLWSIAKYNAPFDRARVHTPLPTPRIDNAP
jgi:transposase